MGFARKMMREQKRREYDEFKKEWKKEEERQGGRIMHEGRPIIRPTFAQWMKQLEARKRMIEQDVLKGIEEARKKSEEEFADPKKLEW